MNDTRSDIKHSLGSDWFLVAFGGLYPIVYAHRTVEDAIPEAVFAAKAVALTSIDKALDLCCGTGRHLVTLERYGASLTGVDYSPQLLAMARRQVSSATDLVRADMRALPMCGCFDVVFSFFTSFGYFMDDKDNIAAATNMACTLKPSGRFFMDYLNPLSLEQHLQPETVRESCGYTILEKRWIDHEHRRVNKTISVSCDGMLTGRTSESVRLYTLEELTALLQDAGLQVSNVWGDYSGGAYDKDAERMILTGRKPV